MTVDAASPLASEIGGQSTLVSDSASALTVSMCSMGCMRCKQYILLTFKIKFNSGNFQ
jgi:hypothetical protein